MSEKVIFRKIINGIPIVVTVNDEKLEQNDKMNNLNFCYVKVGDIWSINMGEDMTIIIKALLSEEFTVLAYGSEHLIAFRNDLERTGVISKETNNLISELRKDKRPKTII